MTDIYMYLPTYHQSRICAPHLYLIAIGTEAIGQLPYTDGNIIYNKAILRPLLAIGLWWPAYLTRSIQCLERRSERDPQER